LFAFLGCQQKEPADQSAAASASSLPRVTVITPERKTIRQTVEQPAQIEAFEVTPLYARVAGYISQMHVDIGDRIEGPKFDTDGKLAKAGQPLAELSIPEVDDEVRQKAAAIVQAKAEEEQARAAVKVADAKVTTAQALVVETAAAISKATAEYDRAKSEYERFVQLAAGAAVTQKNVDEAKERFASADAERARAAAGRTSAQATVKESEALLEKAKADLAASAARVEVAQADHARARAIAQYGTIRAPYDGIVSRRNVHTGHLVQAATQGEPLLVVMRTEPVRVFLDVPEADADLINDGDEAVIRIPAMNGREFRGVVKRSSWSLDNSARTLKTEVDVPNEDGRLRPGMYAYTRIVADEHKDAIVLPTSAIGNDKGESFCLAIENGKIARKPVTLGLRSPGELEIATGLEGNEKVVRGNLSAYLPGQAVEAIAVALPK
jgi:RND family efflux transporter MFP subunit